MNQMMIIFEILGTIAFSISGAIEAMKREMDLLGVLVLGLVTLVLGVVLVICPFQAFTTVVRLLGAFLLYDGLSDLWITGQVGKAVRQTEKAANAEKNAVDVEYRDVKDE